MAFDVNELKATLQRELDSLRQTGQECRVHAALARADMKSEYDRLELLLQRIQADVSRMGEHMKAPLNDIEVAARKLFDEAEHGFKRLRDALRADPPH